MFSTDAPENYQWKAVGETRRLELSNGANSGIHSFPEQEAVIFCIL